MIIRVYADSSGGRRIVGLGAVVVCDGSESAFGTAFRPGCMTTDAEILAICFAVDFLRAVIKTRKESTRDAMIVMHSDCESAVRAINGVLTLKNPTRSLVKNLIEELDRLVGREFAGWKMKLIPRKDNKADQPARKARQIWLRRFKQKNSGPS